MLICRNACRGRTKCLDCGQLRVDRAYENRAGE